MRGGVPAAWKKLSRVKALREGDAMDTQSNPKVMAFVPLFILATSLNTLGIVLASGGWLRFLLMAAGLGMMLACLVKAVGAREQATRAPGSARGVAPLSSLAQQRMPKKSTKSDTDLPFGLAQAFYRIFSTRVVTESPSDHG